MTEKYDIINIGESDRGIPAIIVEDQQPSRLTCGPTSYLQMKMRCKDGESCFDVQRV
jgi:hypothetical protein